MSTYGVNGPIKSFVAVPFGTHCRPIAASVVEILNGFSAVAIGSSIRRAMGIQCIANNFGGKYFAPSLHGLWVDR
jgi:hypothetical protein